VVHGGKEEKNKFSIPAAARSSLSPPPLHFWPRAGAFGARAVLPPYAQLVWCELYAMKDLQKGKIKKGGGVQT